MTYSEVGGRREQVERHQRDVLRMREVHARRQTGYDHVGVANRLHFVDAVTIDHFVEHHVEIVEHRNHLHRGRIGGERREADDVGEEDAHAVEVLWLDDHSVGQLVGDDWRQHAVEERLHLRLGVDQRRRSFVHLLLQIRDVIVERLHHAVEHALARRLRALQLRAQLAERRPADRIRVPRGLQEGTERRRDVGAERRTLFVVQDMFADVGAVRQFAVGVLAREHLDDDDREAVHVARRRRRERRVPQPLRRRRTNAVLQRLRRFDFGAAVGNGRRHPPFRAEPPSGRALVEPFQLPVGDLHVPPVVDEAHVGAEASVHEPGGVQIRHAARHVARQRELEVIVQPVAEVLHDVVHRAFARVLDHRVRLFAGVEDAVEAHDVPVTYVIAHPQQLALRAQAERVTLHRLVRAQRHVVAVVDVTATLDRRSDRAVGPLAGDGGRNVRQGSDALEPSTSGGAMRNERRQWDLPFLPQRGAVDARLDPHDVADERKHHRPQHRHQYPQDERQQTVRLQRGCFSFLLQPD